MGYNVEIRIFGTVSNPEAIWELAEAAAAEGKADWFTQIDREGFVSMLEEAGKDGRPVSLMKHDSTDCFDEVRACCQAADLSYDMRIGERGREGFSKGYSWSPGAKAEFTYDLDGKNPVLRLAAVEKAAKTGIEAVNELVESVTAHTRIGKIEIAPGFLDAYRAYAGAGATP